MESHLKTEQLAGFLEGRPERTQARLLVTHLLRGCPQCAAEVSECLRPSREVPPSAYDVAFEKAYAKVRTHLARTRPLPRLVIRQSVFALPGSPI
jgi:hypothetical protein